MNILGKINSVYIGICNIIVWFPIIWKDRQWQQSFIFEILNHKLKRMEKFYRSDQVYSVEALEIADEIKHAQEITQRILDDNYLSVTLEEYEKLYEGKEIMKFEKVDGEEYSKVVWTEDQEQMEMFRKAGVDADISAKKDLDDFLDFMKENIEKWWD
jgi:hypothetical protein